MYIYNIKITVSGKIPYYTFGTMCFEAQQKSWEEVEYTLGNCKMIKQIEIVLFHKKSISICLEIIFKNITKKLRKVS